MAKRRLVLRIRRIRTKSARTVASAKPGTAPAILWEKAAVRTQATTATRRAWQRKASMERRRASFSSPRRAASSVKRGTTRTVMVKVTTAKTTSTTFWER